MKIAIIGPGAMGLLYGSYLSIKNEVTLVGRNQTNMDQIQKMGVTVEETGVSVPEGEDAATAVYHMNAVVHTEKMQPQDLVILFTKAGDSDQALQLSQNIIDSHTILMTLQNGMGHENVLRKYVPEERILIGTTKEGSYRKSPSSIWHSGKGNTAFGTLTGDCKCYQYIADLFTACGFPCEVAADIKGMIWDKLMINASSSVLTGIFQIPQGCVATNDAIWHLAQKLITEICETATADGYEYNASQQIERIHTHLLAAPGGYTSIYADLKAGRKTEVSVINGAVVNAAHRLGIAVPTHEVILDLVHGMEQLAH